MLIHHISRRKYGHGPYIFAETEDYFGNVVIDVKNTARESSIIEAATRQTKAAIGTQF